MLNRRLFLQVAAASAGAVVIDGLSEGLSNAWAANPAGSSGIEHIVVVMMENRSFDHFLSWLPGADGRHDLTFLAPDGYHYPNYPLAPDYQGCGYSDPDHSWEGWLRQSNGGRNDGFLLDPTEPAGFPGVTLADVNTFPAGYYTEHDVPVIGALAKKYVTLDNYFCSFAGETYPNRFYQHAGQTDRDHNSLAPSSLPTIWDQLTAFPPGDPYNNPDLPWGGYYYRDSPFLALWYTGDITEALETGNVSGISFKYAPFFHKFNDTDPAPIVSPFGVSFLDACAAGPAAGLLPNVCLVDPAFDDGTPGTGGDDHPNSDIRLGEKFIADTYHALADNGWLSNTVLMITFDEWGGFYDHVPPPKVIDDTNPADVDHTGDSTTPTDGELHPDYTQLGFRVPAIVVSDLVEPGRVVHNGPYEHTSTLALIESTFGLTPLTARDTNAHNLSHLLLDKPVRHPVNPKAVPTSSDVVGPAIGPPSGSAINDLEGNANFDPLAQCGETSVASVSPAPVKRPRSDVPHFPRRGAKGTAGMKDLMAGTHLFRP